MQTDVEQLGFVNSPQFKGQMTTMPAQWNFLYAEISILQRFLFG